MRFLPLAGLVGSLIFAAFGGAAWGGPDHRPASRWARRRGRRPAERDAILTRRRRQPDRGQWRADRARGQQGHLDPPLRPGGDGLHRQSRHRRCPGQVALADLHQRQGARRDRDLCGRRQRQRAAELAGPGRARPVAAALVLAAIGAGRTDLRRFGRRQSGAERRRVRCRQGGQGAGARRRDRRRGQGLAGDQSNDGRHPEPGQPAGADRRSERYEIERDRGQLVESRVEYKLYDHQPGDDHGRNHQHPNCRAHYRDSRQCHDQRPRAGGVHHEPGRAEPDGDVRSDRQLPRRGRVPGADLRLRPAPPGVSRRSPSNSRTSGSALPSPRRSSTPTISTCGSGPRSASCRPSARCRYRSPAQPP